MSAVEVNTIRDKINALQQRIAKVRSASLPEAQLSDLLDAQLDELESRYLRIVASIGGSLSVSQNTDGFLFTDALLFKNSQKDFLVGCVVRGMREQIRNDILAAAKSHPMDVRMSESERLDTLHKLTREVYGLELKDEAAVVAGQADRRVDADARAVLGLPEEVAFSPAVLDVTRIFGS